jgi:hypothetical protein
MWKTPEFASRMIGNAAYVWIFAGHELLVGVTFSVIIADEKFPPIGARSISVKIPTPVRYSGASSDSGCSRMFDELRVTDVGQIGERGEV